MVVTYFEFQIKNQICSNICFFLITAEKESDKTIEEVHAGIKKNLVEFSKPQ
tara:strand:- start:386 stop:541 length:156 start_codon:yes stop_codon:yes gene_type:complete